MPTPGTVTLDYVTLPTQATPFGSDPTILVEAYLPLSNTIPLTAKIPTGYNTDVFGFQVEDGGYSPARAVDFTITWNPPTGTPAVNYKGNLTLKAPPVQNGKKLRVTILTKKVPKGGSLLTARRTKKKKPTAKATKATKVTTKAKATKKKS
ncbi:MAG: hypothetical protein ACOYKN_13170 [Pirellula sp.]